VLLGTVNKAGDGRRNWREEIGEQRKAKGHRRRETHIWCWPESWTFYFGLSIGHLDQRRLLGAADNAKPVARPAAFVALSLCCWAPTAGGIDGWLKKKTKLTSAAEEAQLPSAAAAAVAAGWSRHKVASTNVRSSSSSFKQLLRRRQRLICRSAAEKAAERRRLQRSGISSGGGGGRQNGTGKRGRGWRRSCAFPVLRRRCQSLPHHRFRLPSPLIIISCFFSFFSATSAEVRGTLMQQHKCQRWRIPSPKPRRGIWHHFCLGLFVCLLYLITWINGNY
jgi:hypothetical protein